MTKDELMNNKVFQLMPGDAEIIMVALGEHRIRTVRRGKTSRTGDKMVMILDTK